MAVFQKKQYQCPMEVTIGLIGGKWKVLILWHLAEDGTLRFGELKKQFPDVTQKMLTQQLRELERDGLINRRVYAEVPPKVEYSLRELGQTLIPVLYSMNQWGTKYINSSLFEETQGTGICRNKR